MGKRENDISSVGQALQRMLDEYAIHNKFDKVDLVSSWGRIVGEPIARRTVRIFVKEDTLFVEVNSASLKQELNMSRSRLLEKIETDLGHKVVKNIVFL